MTIPQKQLQKVARHYLALKEYKEFIDKVGFEFSVEEFNNLDTPQKAVLEAYLKRFSSLQDYLGAKVFRTLLNMAGISTTKMSEVLTLIEKEEIVSLDRWIEFRNIRNELEEALKDLKYCVDSFDYLHGVVVKVFEFARRYDESIKLP